MKNGGWILQDKSLRITAKPPRSNVSKQRGIDPALPPGHRGILKVNSQVQWDGKYWLQSLRVVGRKRRKPSLWKKTVKSLRNLSCGQKVKISQPSISWKLFLVSGMCMDKNSKRKRDQHTVKTSRELPYHTNSKRKGKKKRTFSNNMITRGLLKKSCFHSGGIKSSWWSKLGLISMPNMMQRSFLWL